jgi:zinc and cadmium transporter
MSHDLSVRIVLAAVLGLVAAGGNVLGGYFVVYRDWPRRFLKYFLALGAGYMLAVALVEVIPESIRLGGENALLFVLIGFFLVHVFEHTLAPHFHSGPPVYVEGGEVHAMAEHGEGHGGHSHDANPQHSRSTVMVGLAIHTFFDGVAIAAGFMVSTWLGAVIFLAVFLHKVPEGFTVASLEMAGGHGKKSAMRAAGLLGATTLAGVLLTSQLQNQLKYALPLSGGVALYVAATDLLPEVNREPGWRMPLLVLVGVGSLLILKLFFHV